MSPRSPPARTLPRDSLRYFLRHIRRAERAFWVVNQRSMRGRQSKNAHEARFSIPRTRFWDQEVAGSNPAAPILRALTPFCHRCHFLL